MEEKQQGYEAHYVFSDHMTITQYHCHDYYEIYLQFQKNMQKS